MDITLKSLSAVALLSLAATVSFAESSNIVSGAGVVRTYRNTWTQDEITRDSKPAVIPAADQLFLRQDVIAMGAARIRVLVNRLTKKVEYVWSPVYKRYVRPKFIMPNVQGLFNRSRL